MDFPVGARVKAVRGIYINGRAADGLFGEVIYTDARTQTVTVRLYIGQTVHCSPGQLERAPGKGARGPSETSQLTPARLIAIAAVVVLGLALTQNRPGGSGSGPISPEVVAPAGLQPVATPQAVVGGQPKIEIRGAKVSVGTGSFVITGQLTNYGSLAARNSVLTAIIHNHSGQEIGRQNLTLETLPAQSAQPFSFTFPVSASGVAGYQLTTSSKY